MKIATVGVHVLDTHVIGIESIPRGLGRPARRDDPALAGRHRRRHRGGAAPARRRGAQLRRGRGRTRSAPACSRCSTREGVDTAGPGPQGRPADLVVGDPGPAERRPAGLALHRRQRRVHPRRPRPRPRSTGSPTCTSAVRSSSAARRPASCSRTRARSAPTTSLDLLAPGDPDMLAWIADALPQTDYLLPNDEQVLGFTGAASLAEGAPGAGREPASAASRSPRARRARSSSRPTRRSRCRRTTSRSSTPPAAATRSRPASCAASPWAATCAAPPSSAAPPPPRSRRGSAPTPAPTPRLGRGVRRPHATRALATPSDGDGSAVLSARAARDPPEP